MKTKTGYETDGTYLKWKSGYTTLWCVETEKQTHTFRTEIEADTFILELNKSDVMLSLPHEINLIRLGELLRFSDRYDISIQFWRDQIAVYIEKDGVELIDYGGDFEFAVGKSVEYLNRITGGNGA